MSSMALARPDASLLPVWANGANFGTTHPALHLHNWIRFKHVATIGCTYRNQLEPTERAAVRPPKNPYPIR